jgi:hypothetical protein
LIGARALVLVACAAAIVLLAARLRDHDRCADAQSAVFLAPRSAGPGTLRTLRSSCRETGALASAAVSLATAGRHAEGLALARTAVRREPDGFENWVALSLVQRRAAPAQSARAEARARRLNPRWRGL